MKKKNIGPLISVVIPVYNVQEYLCQCLDSVLRQEIKKIEIICINDGSTDDSLRILNEYKKKDSKIKVFSQKNKGQGAARNIGFKKATGDYVIFLDSDDWLERGSLKKLYFQAIKNNTDLIVFGIKGFDHSSQKEYRDSFFEPHFFDTPAGKETTFNSSDIQNKEDVFFKAISVANKFYKRKFLLDNGLTFPEGVIFEDLYFGIISILLAKRISVNSEAFYVYRTNRPCSTMKSKIYTESILDIFKVMDLVRESILEENVSDEYRFIFIKFLLSQFVGYLIFTEGKTRELFLEKIKESVDQFKLDREDIEELGEFRDIYQTVKEGRSLKDLLIRCLELHLQRNTVIKENLQRELDIMKDDLGHIRKEHSDIMKEVYEIKNSKTWRYGVMLTTAIKDPKQIPAIIKKLLIKIAKKFLPAGTRTRIKKFMGKHPYLTNPRILIHLRKNKKTLKEILEKEKYKGIIIYPPTIDWDMPLFQRPQQLALAFAKEGYLFFYGTANLNHDKVNGFKRVENNLYVTNQVELLRGVEGTTLFISWPINKYFVEKFPKAKLIYDYIDELDVFDAAGATEKEMIKNHKELVREADLVVCTADKLLNDVKKLNPKKAILAPNAVTLSHFSVKPKKAAEDIGEFVKAKKKIIGYYGAIAEWFDYDLLEKIAELRPEYEFVMIGPLDYDKTLSHNKHLFEIKNIHFIGAKKFEELPSYLYYFDVAIIPFLINKITESTSPVKLFEYMAGGRPIVTTPMHECKKYKSVLIADGAGEFVAKLDEAIRLKEDRDYKNQLAQDAKENTWKARVEQIIKNIN